MNVEQLNRGKLLPNEVKYAMAVRLVHFKGHSNNQYHFA